MKKGDKSGQFYLLAVVIILAILFGLGAITNYSKKKELARVDDLREELIIESQKVLEYETIKSEDKIEDFAKKYSEYAGEDIEIIFITGEESSIEVYKYFGGLKQDVSYEKEGNELNVTVDDVEHSFDLNSGDNFYFIVLQEIGGEKYVATN